MTTKAELTRFEQSILVHLDAAYNLARWLTRNDHDAQDVVQEASLRAFQYFSGFHGTNARGWLLTIVRNTYYTWQRNRPPESASIPLDEMDELEASSPDPEAALAQFDDHRKLGEALERLPIEFREAIVLRELEGCSYKEVADIMGIPIGTVMSRLARGRKLLIRTLVGEEARS